jgi:hypothetical protein
MVGCGPTYWRDEKVSKRDDGIKLRDIFASISEG